jgi:hypothetical protein
MAMSNHLLLILILLSLPGGGALLAISVGVKVIFWLLPVIAAAGFIMLLLAINNPMAALCGFAVLFAVFVMYVGERTDPEYDRIDKLIRERQAEDRRAPEPRISNDQ